MKKEQKTIEEKTFTTNEVGSMIERFDEKLSTLAESMDIKFENVNQKFDTVDKRFDGMDNRFNKVEAKIDRLQDDMVEVKFELKQKVSVDQFQRLERRVTKLERLSLSHQS